jgi:peptidoglycan/LPS O-acetylase OafA/YrhL
VTTAHRLDPDAHKIAALDGARGIAVLAVMASHFEAVLPPIAILQPLKQAAFFGSAGVDLFFVLSGFLITGILMNTRNATNYFIAFYARRILRIFPIYYLTLAFMFWIRTVLPAASAEIPPAGDRPYYYFFLDNWIAWWRGAWPPNAIGHFWSLAVEEQFYLFWPPLVLLLSATSLKRLIIVVALAVLTFRSYWIFSFGSHPGPMLSTATRCDGLLLGSFCAILYAEKWTISNRVLLVWIVIPLAAFFGISIVPESGSRTFYALGFTLLAISFAALVLRLALSDGEPTATQRFFGSSALRTIGRHSYGMYVYHVPLFWLSQVLFYNRLDSQTKQNPYITMLFFGALFAITYLVAAVSYTLLERPLLNLKQFFRPKLSNARFGERAASL